MESSKWITKVFGSLRFDYHAQRNKFRCTSTAEELERHDEVEPSVRHARGKSPSKPKSRGRTQS